MSDRTGLVTLLGNPVTLTGTPVTVGKPAPAFTALNGELAPVTPAGPANEVRVFLAVPSLDTPVCDTETRRFNREAVALGTGVTVYAISMDLPFAQARWCGAAGVANVHALSDHKDADFGLKYGILIKEARLLARAVFVVDRAGVVRYIDVVSEVADEPDYDAALAAIRQLL